MQVDGIDRAREAYRVRLSDGTRGYVPEGLVMETLGLDRRPGHEEVYLWLDRNAAAVVTALKTEDARAPFDRITKAGDT